MRLIDADSVLNGIETPAELAATIRSETGFDVYLPPSEETVLQYIPIKGAQND